MSELLSEDGSGGGSFHTNTSTVSSHTHADVLSQRSCTLTPHNSRAVESKSAETVFSTHKTEVLRKKLSGPFRDACTSSSASDVHPSLARLVQTLRGRMDKEHVSKELRKQTPPGQQLSHTLARQTERLKIEVIKHKLEAQIKVETKDVLTCDHTVVFIGGGCVFRIRTRPVQVRDFIPKGDLYIAQVTINDVTLFMVSLYHIQ